MRVPFFDMRAEVARDRAAIDVAIARVLDSGTFVGGPEVEGFERALAAATVRPSSASGTRFWASSSSSPWKVPQSTISPTPSCWSR